MMAEGGKEWMEEIWEVKRKGGRERTLLNE